VVKTHEDCAIAVVNGDLSMVTHHQLIHDITNYIFTQYQLTVRFFALHPHGVGIFKLRNACQHDALLALNPHFVGHREVTFYPHDEASINFRRISFTRKCWIMLLGYPLDFKDVTTLVEVYTPFARVLHWNSKDTSMSRVLLKVLVEDWKSIMMWLSRWVENLMERVVHGLFPFTFSTLRRSWLGHRMRRTLQRTMGIHILSMGRLCNTPCL
jgi:hypothetical protein